MQLSNDILLNNNTSRWLNGAHTCEICSKNFFSLKPRDKPLATNLYIHTHSSFYAIPINSLLLLVLSRPCTAEFSSGLPVVCNIIYTEWATSIRWYLIANNNRYQWDEFSLAHDWQEIRICVTSFQFSTKNNLLFGCADDRIFNQYGVVWRTIHRNGEQYENLIVCSDWRGLPRQNFD